MRRICFSRCFLFFWCSGRATPFDDQQTLVLLTCSAETLLLPANPPKLNPPQGEFAQRYRLHQNATGQASTTVGDHVGSPGAVPFLLAPTIMATPTIEFYLLCCVCLHQTDQPFLHFQYYYCILRTEHTVCVFLLLLPSAALSTTCLLYTSPSPRDLSTSRMPSSA